MPRARDMRPVKVLPPPSASEDGPTPVFGTRVLNADGIQIPRVTKVSIHLDTLRGCAEAEITVDVQVGEVWAYPWMSEANFLEAAKRYGYEVKKR